MLERPALSVSEIGILLVGLVLTVIGLNNFIGAFTADRLAFLGGLIFLLAGAGCLAVGLCTLRGFPRSVRRRAKLMIFAWVGAAYPLSLAFTFFGSAYLTALPVALVGISLALISLGEMRKSSVN